MTLLNKKLVLAFFALAALSTQVAMGDGTFTRDVCFGGTDDNKCNEVNDADDEGEFFTYNPSGGEIFNISSITVSAHDHVGESHSAKLKVEAIPENEGDDLILLGVRTLGGGGDFHFGVNRRVRGFKFSAIPDQQDDEAVIYHISYEGEVVETEDDSDCPSPRQITSRIREINDRLERPNLRRAVRDELRQERRALRECRQ